MRSRWPGPLPVASAGGIALTTFYFRCGRESTASGQAEYVVCDPDHRHLTRQEALACASGSERNLSSVLAVRRSASREGDARAERPGEPVGRPSAKAAREQFAAALAAFHDRRRSDCLRACHAVSRSAGKATALHRAAYGLELLAGHALVSDGASVVDLGREQLDRCFDRVPARLRVQCESAYYGAAMKFIKDRAVEAVGLSAFLERYEDDGVPGLAPLYRMLAKLQYGANDMAAARTSFERGLAKLRKEPDILTELRICVELGLTHAKLGDTVAALDLIETSIARFATLELNDEVLSGCAGAMYVLSRAHRFEEVRTWGTYALARLDPTSPGWSAVLLYDVAAIDLMLGQPAQALERLASHGDSIERMGECDRAMVAAVEATAKLYLDRFGEAETCIRIAMRHESEQWVRLSLRNVQALLLEMTGERERALEHALFVMNYPGCDGNAVQFRSAAAVQVARLLYRLGVDRFAQARAVCESLVDGHPAVEIALEHVAAYERLFAADSAGADALAAAVRRHPDRFARALNAFAGATFSADSRELHRVRDEFAAIGSATMADCVGETLERIVSVAHRRGLSSREAELARHVASGKTNAEIAGLLGLSRKTVDNHISNILSKCGIRSRVEIAALVIRSELPVHAS